MSGARSSSRFTLQVSLPKDTLVLQLLTPRRASPFPVPSQCEARVKTFALSSRLSPSCWRPIHMHREWNSIKLINLTPGR